MNRIGKLLSVMVMGVMVLFTVRTVEALEISTIPKANNGKAWQIGYYEGGPYPNYYKYLRGTVLGLMDFGWIPKQEIPVFDENEHELWLWLANSVKSKYITFRQDAFYSAKWDKTTRHALSETIIDRLANKNDIDLMFAMGTWAGKDLANDRHHTNTMVMSTSDPIGSNIISSAEDSGRDHIHARVDPKRYERQVRTFHELVGFNRLGVAYENTVAGRSYAAIDLIEKVANEGGFEIERCYTNSDIANSSLASESVIKCFNQFASKGVDAIYMTAQGGVNEDSIGKLVEIANENRIPTFSQVGSKEVKHGILMSISRAGGFRPAGRFFAATLAQICNGAKPRQLNQVFEENQNIAINLKTAELIGFYLHAEILAAADEIYSTIESP